MYRAIWLAPFKKKGKTKQTKQKKHASSLSVYSTCWPDTDAKKPERAARCNRSLGFFFSPPLAFVFISGVCSYTLHSTSMPRNQTETLFKSRSSHQSAPLTVARRSARVQPSPGSSGECFIIDTNWSATLVGCAVSAEQMGC